MEKWKTMSFKEWMSQQDRTVLIIYSKILHTGQFHWMFEILYSNVPVKCKNKTKQNTDTWAKASLDNTMFNTEQDGLGGWSLAAQVFYL